MAAIAKVANQSTIVDCCLFHQSTIVDTLATFVLFFRATFRLEFFQEKLKPIVHTLEFIRDRYQINHLTLYFVLEFIRDRYQINHLTLYFFK